MITKEEILNAPKRKWDEVLNDVSSVYVIPNGKIHDSGFSCMDFVAEKKDRTLIKFGGGCDDVKLEGEHFSVDCLQDGTIRIWNYRKLFTISEDLSTIFFTEE